MSTETETIEFANQPVEEYPRDGSVNTLEPARLASLESTPKPESRDLERALPKPFLAAMSGFMQTVLLLADAEEWSHESAAQLSVLIGARQQEHAEGNRQSINLVGDSSSTVESTAGIVDEVHRQDPKHILFRSAEARIEWFKRVFDEEERLAASAPELLDSYWKRFIAPAIVAPIRFMPFVYYATWKKFGARQDAQKAADVFRLLRRSRILSGMEVYSKGIASAFVNLLGEDLFVETTSGIQAFQNRYYFDYRVRPAQTLRDLYRERWGHMYAFRVPQSEIPSFEEFLAGLLQAHQNYALSQLSPVQPLLDAGVTTVWLCPPLRQSQSYQERIKLFRAGTLGKEATKIETALKPEDRYALPGYRILRDKKTRRILLMAFDVQRRQVPKRDPALKTIHDEYRRDGHPLEPALVKRWSDELAAIQTRESDRAILLAPDRKRGISEEMEGEQLGDMSPAPTMAPAEIERRIIELGESVRTLPEPPQITELRQLLGGLKSRDIQDKDAFVEATNRILRATGYRIQLPDGSLALLRLTRRDANNAWIRCGPTAGGMGQILGNTRLNLVRLSPDKRGS